MSEAIFTTLLILSLFWWAICMCIGIMSNKNKWGPDSVENWCNACEDRANFIFWALFGFFGMILIFSIGAILK